MPYTVHALNPQDSGENNVRILQDAIDRYKDVFVETPGRYPLAGTVLLGDRVHLRFAPGVEFQRRAVSPFTGYAFINRGAFTGEIDENITVDGLHLFTCGVQSTPASPQCSVTIPGQRGHISFIGVRNLTLRDIVIPDLSAKDYGIQISRFENVLVEHIRIEGDKDGIHFGPGKNFIVRHAVFRTFDDPVALNGSDYSVSNPYLGWIENGLIEDVTDLDDSATTGYFARLLAGAWTDWYEGMEIQQSDTVVHNGRLYRVVMKPDGQRFRSVTPPTHESGFAELDGILWSRHQPDVLYTAGCRNIVFRNIHLQKKRRAAIALTLNTDDYLRSYYPHSKTPVQGGITLENVFVENQVDRLLHVSSPLSDLTVRGGDVGNARIFFRREEHPGMEYPKTALTLENVSAKAEDLLCGDLKNVSLSER